MKTKYTETQSGVPESTVIAIATFWLRQKYFHSNNGDNLITSRTDSNKCGLTAVQINKTSAFYMVLSILCVQTISTVKSVLKANNLNFTYTFLPAGQHWMEDDEDRYQYNCIYVPKHMDTNKQILLTRQTMVFNRIIK